MTKKKGSDVDPFADEEVEAAPPPDAAQLGAVATIVKELVAERAALARALGEVARLSARVRAIEEGTLPAAMIHAGMAGYDILGGGRIEIKTDVYASLGKKDVEKKLAFIRSSGAEDLIKRTVTAGFGRGDNTSAALVEWLRENAPKATIAEKETIAPNTLKAWVRAKFFAGELVEGSEGFATLGAHVRRYADVVIPEGAAGALPKKSRSKSEDQPDEEE